MRILVGIKWVPRVDQMKFDPVTKTLVRVGVESVVNPPDLNALEMGLQIRDKVGGEVIAVSMAPPVAKEGLMEAVSMGADRGILLTDRRMAGADTLATSRVLAEAAKKLKADLILVGEETIDSATGQVGPGIAVHLGIPFISYVHKVLEIGDESITVERESERGVEVWRLGLPALLTVVLGANKPRRPTIRGKIRAKRAIDFWSLDDLGIDPECVGFPGSPTRVVDMVVVEPPKRRGEIFQGEAAEAAKWLADKILEVLKGGL